MQGHKMKIIRSIVKSVCGIVLLFILAHGYAPATEQCSQAAIGVQVLGSGGPEFYTDRASSSYLVWQDGKAIVMVDAGSGSKFRFGQSGADFNTIKYILFSHFHVDHSADFPGYIKSAFFSDRDLDLAVYGPEGNQFFPSANAFVKAMIGTDDSAYPYLSRYLTGGDEYRIHVNNVKINPREVINVQSTNGITISAIPVRHGPLPALAWRVDIGGKSIVFSGDMNGEFHTLEKLAKDADLLVAHNAVSEQATGVARNLHMPPSVIGEIAGQAAVKKLVLSHRMHRTLGIEKQSLDIIRKHYSNAVSFANDLDCFIP
jgi:ribonuclease BN (tRNA processing enzyme)